MSQYFDQLPERVREDVRDHIQREVDDAVQHHREMIVGVTSNAVQAYAADELSRDTLAELLDPVAPNGYSGEDVIEAMESGADPDVLAEQMLGGEYDV